ncbi:hypothetical protein GCM10010433_47950 [Streptomyces pulveraceus]
MRTSMAMAWAPVGSGEVAWGARLSPRAGVGAYVCCSGRGPGSGLAAGGQAAGTDRAGEPAQVDVQARDEQCARRRVAHVMGNHALIVSIPGP